MKIVNHQNIIGTRYIELLVAQGWKGMGIDMQRAIGIHGARQAWG
jgi:hypothetical protein